jgi:tetratricopeptide (TPR) repeat protein
MGQFDLAIEKCQEALSIKPDFNYALGNLVVACGLKGDYREALKWADEKISRSTLPQDKADGYLLKAFFEYWTGAFLKAHEDAGKARKSAEAIDYRPFHYWSYLLEGFAHLAQGNFSLAGESFVQGCDIPMKDSPRPLVHRSTEEYLLGFTDLRRKETGSARARLGVMSGFLAEIQDPDDRKYVESHKKYIESLLDLLRGEVLLAEGSIAEAISLFERHPSCYIEGYRSPHTQIDEIAEINFFQPEAAIARAYEIKGETDKAIDVLEKLVRFDPGRKFLRLPSPNDYAIAWRLTPPQAYYDLGRLYEKKGMKEKARENYGKFLDLWKDADPGLPKVEDVKERLGGLKGTGPAGF